MECDLSTFRILYFGQSESGERQFTLWQIRGNGSVDIICKLGEGELKLNGIEIHDRGMFSKNSDRYVLVPVKN